MKTKKPVVLLIAALVTLGVFFFPGFVGGPVRSETVRIVKAFQMVRHDRLEAAVNKFVQHKNANGETAPESVAMRELLAGGYLESADVAGLEGRDVMVSLNLTPADPRTSLMRLKLADGREFCLMTDGSVQVFGQK